MVSDLIVDNFAGGGGASTGIEAALGRPVDYAIDHSEAAIEIHKLNHPGTTHLCEDVFAVSPRRLCGGRRVGLAWFSPDCTHFSRAKGGKPRSRKIRGLAWVAVRWAREVRPLVIMLENVAEFRTWGPLGEDGRPIRERRGETFREWVGALKGLGYAVDWRELTAADYGAPTTRKRLFLVARCDWRPIVWPEPTHAKAPAAGQQRWRSAAECIDWGLPVRSIFGRKRPLAESTLKRIAEGMRRFVFETGEPFLVTCNHGGSDFRGQGLGAPFCTITASRDAYGLVVPSFAGCGGAGYAGKPVGAGRPYSTVMPNDRKALCAAFLSQYFGGMTGKDLGQPVPTVTAIDHKAVVAASLISNNTNNAPHGLNQPLGTITTGNRHYVQAGFLQTQAVNAAKARLGLVTVAGVDWELVDIGLRMLEPHELLIAQGFPRDYALAGSKANRVAMIGNSVPPPVAEAIVRANCGDLALEAVA